MDTSEALSARAQRITAEANLPPLIKSAASKLLDRYGWEWWSQLHRADDPKGPGTSGISFEIELPGELAENIGEIANSQDDGALSGDPLGLYDDFIFNQVSDYEDAHEDEEEEDFPDERDWPLHDFLCEWRDERVSFRRTVLGQKTPEARWRTYAEVDRLDLGGRESLCRTCGVTFFDNFHSRINEEAFYCSLECIGDAEFSCLECGDRYQVGMKSNRANRRRRLASWCSEACENPWVEADKESVGWVRQMVRRARELGREYDRDITRRKVFDQAEGTCHYCGKKTHWKAKAFSPYLATVDHVVPWEKGGHHIWTNVVLACWLCNAMKGTRLEFSSRGDREKWTREN